MEKVRTFVSLIPARSLSCEHWDQLPSHSIRSKILAGFGLKVFRIFELLIEKLKMIVPTQCVTILDDTDDQNNES
jgi:hypothetical protein